MDTRPLFIFELHIKDFAIEQSFDFDSFFKNEMHVFLEQEGRSVDILILNKVVNDQVDSPYLVVSESVIYSRPIKVLVYTVFAFVLKI